MHYTSPTVQQGVMEMAGGCHRSELAMHKVSYCIVRKLGGGGGGGVIWQLFRNLPQNPPKHFH